MWWPQHPPVTHSSFSVRQMIGTLICYTFPPPLILITNEFFEIPHLTGFCRVTDHCLRIAALLDPQEKAQLKAGWDPGGRGHERRGLASQEEVPGAC